MTGPDFGFAAIAAVLLVGIAWSDARRMTVEPWAGLTLIVTGVAWHVSSPSDLGMVSLAWWMPLLGLAAGAAAVAIPITIAEVLARRWPLMPGDGILLGGIGACLGPLGLAWALIAGAALTTAYRACLQKKRRRPLTAGYAPLGPGMAAGALLVLALAAGGQAVARGDGGGADDVRLERLPDHLVSPANPPGETP
ncbi:MAG: hypothetical protein OXK73_17575 [Rhodospirillaceae bacterium]|nr:hypothetical protein [Rhodospirillaceae bacterium]